MKVPSGAYLSRRCSPSASPTYRLPVESISTDSLFPPGSWALVLPQSQSRRRRRPETTQACKVLLCQRCKCHGFRMWLGLAPRSPYVDPSFRGSLRPPKVLVDELTGALHIEVHPDSVAGLGARIGERLARDRNKLPVETRLVQSQLKNAEGSGVADQAVGSDSSIEGRVFDPAGADHNLDDTFGGVQVAVCILRREALVVVAVAVHHQVDI